MRLRSLRRCPLLAVLCALAVALACGCSRPAVAPRKVAILAIDGMDWRLIDPLLEEGRLPNLASLIERGVRRDFRSLEPHQKSAVIGHC